MLCRNKTTSIVSFILVLSLAGCGPGEGGDGSDGLGSDMDDDNDVNAECSTSCTEQPGICMIRCEDDLTLEVRDDLFHYDGEPVGQGWTVSLAADVAIVFKVPSISSSTDLIIFEQCASCTIVRRTIADVTIAPGSSHRQVFSKGFPEFNYQANTDVQGVVVIVQ